jgi:hypothetical protein
LSLLVNALFHSSSPPALMRLKSAKERAPTMRRRKAMRTRTSHPSFRRKRRSSSRRWATTRSGRLMFCESLRTNSSAKEAHMAFSLSCRHGLNSTVRHREGPAGLSARRTRSRRSHAKSCTGV